MIRMWTTYDLVGAEQCQELWSCHNPWKDWWCQVIEMNPLDWPMFLCSSNFQIPIQYIICPTKYALIAQDKVFWSNTFNYIETIPKSYWKWQWKFCSLKVRYVYPNQRWVCLVIWSGKSSFMAIWSRGSWMGTLCGLSRHFGN